MLTSTKAKAMIDHINLKSGHPNKMLTPDRIIEACFFQLEYWLQVGYEPTTANVIRGFTRAEQDMDSYWTESDIKKAYKNLCNNHEPSEQQLREFVIAAIYYGVRKDEKSLTEILQAAAKHVQLTLP